MRILTAMIVCFFLLFSLSLSAEECTSVPLEYYMADPVQEACSDITPGVEFLNPYDDVGWRVETVDENGVLIEQVEYGAAYYIKITGSGEWGIGYMPHLYAPGNYFGVPLSWEQVWTGGPSYTGSAQGEISDLDDIVNRNPLTVYDPNLITKTVNFAGANGINTLIMAQEQVFPGFWGGPWTEPDGETISWTFGPFVLNIPSDFTFRILLSPVWNSDMYIADYDFTICENLPVMSGGSPSSYYLTLQGAYEDAADEGLIMAQDIIYEEDFNANFDKAVSLHGGFNCQYITNAGVTKIYGDMTVTSGKLTVQSGMLQLM